MKIERISIDRINPAPYNPRQDLRPGDPEYLKLQRSIEEFGPPARRRCGSTSGSMTTVSLKR